MKIISRSLIVEMDTIVFSGRVEPDSDLFHHSPFGTHRRKIAREFVRIEKLLP
jgi:hypothetical protein